MLSLRFRRSLHSSRAHFFCLVSWCAIWLVDSKLLLVEYRVKWPKKGEISRMLFGVGVGLAQSVQCLDYRLDRRRIRIRI